MVGERNTRGFTLIELMVVIAMLGVLVAIAIPNFIGLQDRAKEGSLKANMHTFQMASEDYGVQHGGVYSLDANGVVGLLPGGDSHFLNAFARTWGIGTAWEDRAAFSANVSSIPGITSYADSSSGLTYNIKGYGKNNALTIVLSPGQ
jgi:prepilin-type N-terminal cleavage/methylation domain-containing protein